MAPVRNLEPSANDINAELPKPGQRMTRTYLSEKKAKQAVTATAVAFAIIIASCTQMTTPPNPVGEQRMPNEINQPEHIGTGVLLQNNNQEYVVTALHVAQDCNFEPLIDVFGTWTPSTWKTIGTDEKNDIAVLQRVGAEDPNIGKLAALYGREGTVHGATAVAMGFPGTTEPITWTRMGEHFRPLPMLVPTLLYFGADDSHYSGGYLNYGFSGGPIVAWTGSQAIITGIITKKANTLRPDGEIEHAGLVGVSDIAVAERIVAEYNNQTIEEFRNGKPKAHSTVQERRLPETLSPAEIIDAVIRLGR